jgi:hypothetical protein
MARPLITVKALMQQVRKRGRVQLPENALISPAAADWLRGTHVQVQRTGAVQLGGRGDADGKSARAIYLVGDEHEPCVQTLVPELERRHAGLRFRPVQPRVTSLIVALVDMCAALNGCARTRGIAIVNEASLVTCLANRFPRVRGAIVARASELHALMRRMALNLLILPLGDIALRQQAALIDSFLAGRADFEPELEAGLQRVSAMQELPTGPTSCGKPACSGGCGGCGTPAGAGCGCGCASAARR